MTLFHEKRQFDTNSTENETKWPSIEYLAPMKTELRYQNKVKKTFTKNMRELAPLCEIRQITAKPEFPRYQISGIKSDEMLASIQKNVS